MGDIMNESELTLTQQCLFKTCMKRTKKALSFYIIDTREDLNEERAKHIELQEDYHKACDYYKKLEKEVVELKKFINEHPVNVVKLDDENDLKKENEALKQRISFQEGLSKKQTKCLMSKDREINKLTKIIEEHWGKSEEDIIKENTELKKENSELNYQVVNHTHGLETINTLKKENTELKKQNQDLLNHSVAFGTNGLEHINKLLKINKRYEYKCKTLNKIVKKNVLTLLHDYDELVDVDPTCGDCGHLWDESDTDEEEDLSL